MKRENVVSNRSIRQVPALTAQAQDRSTGPSYIAGLRAVRARQFSAMVSRFSRAHGQS